MGKLDIQEKPHWYLNGLRDILQSLLANPSFTRSVIPIADLLREVNDAQRRPKTREDEQER